MEYRIAFDAQANIIRATAAGEWEAHTDEAMVDEMMKVVRATGARKILVDLRELNANLATLRLYEHARSLLSRRAQAGAFSTRVAIVYKPVNARVEQGFQFFETTARNRGLPYRVFAAIAPAQDWLLAGPVGSA
jgi:hypothetical protein